MEPIQLRVNSLMSRIKFIFSSKLISLNLNPQEYVNMPITYISLNFLNDEATTNFALKMFQKPSFILIFQQLRRPEFCHERDKGCSSHDDSSLQDSSRSRQSPKMDNASCTTIQKWNSFAVHTN